jgi:hypothetical protein
MEVLREWAEKRAVETIEWYLRDKRKRRVNSRLLRATAVIFGVTGGIVPLLAVTFAAIRIEIGYILLALAAGCLAFDHFFGVSSGWMRDIITSQKLQGRLTRFQIAWAVWQARESGALKIELEGTQDGVHAGLDLIESLVTDVVDATDRETAEWATEFNAAVAALRQRSGTTMSASNDTEVFR